MRWVWIYVWIYSALAIFMLLDAAIQHSEWWSAFFVVSALWFAFMALSWLKRARS